MKYRYGIIGLLILALSAPVSATIVTKTVEYQHDGTPLKGYLAYDDAVSGRRPAVLVVHEWWGLNDYAQSRAKQLAQLGYVAFALDMYGADKVTQHPDKASEWMKQTTANVDTWRSRARAGLAVLQAQKQTDPARMAAIGYCFGGATVQQLAYSGADLKAVVSFHGTPIPPPAGGTDTVVSKFLILHGAADPFIKPEQVQAYTAAMGATDLDWQMVFYSGAKHGYTNPDAGKYGLAPVQYNERADKRSWQHMQLFFNELLTAP
jgi:dienelactone hydrolase